MRDPSKALPATQPSESRSAQTMAYPTGMVWCPMKMSGMAILRCARLQRKLGCGTLRELRALKKTRPESGILFWPWLDRRGECPERATEAEIHELLLEVTPLKLVKTSRENIQSHHCPHCGGRKAVKARRCRRCWMDSAKQNRGVTAL